MQGTYVSFSRPKGGISSETDHMLVMIECLEHIMRSLTLLLAETLPLEHMGNAKSGPMLGRLSATEMDSYRLKIVI